MSGFNKGASLWPARAIAACLVLGMCIFAFGRLAAQDAAAPVPWVAPDDAYGPGPPGSLGAGSTVGKGGELVWHGHEDPVHVRRGGEGGHDDVEVSRRHLHGDAHAIVAALPESAGQAHRGLDVFDRVADDGKQSRCATELVEHVDSRLSCRWL